MNPTTCDNWVVLRVAPKDKPVFYRLLVGWHGGYLSSSAWRMNSGVVSARHDGQYYLFFGVSGSVYKTHKNGYGLRSNNDYVYRNFLETWGRDVVSIMPEDTDWVNLDWNLEAA